MSDRTLFEELGGEARLRTIVDRFVDRVCDDVMIGFFFARVSRARLKEKEYEFAAAHLGANVTYTGRLLPDAHGKHEIMGGHFMRRLRILEQTLDELGVPARVKEHWVLHTLALKDLITRARECSPTGAAS